MMNIRALLIDMIVISLLLLSACNDKKAQQKKQKPRIPVVRVMKKDVPVYASYLGQVYGQKDIPIRARVQGFLESIDFKEGSKVKKGQLLYTIDPQSLEEARNAQQSEVTAAQTALTKAKADLDRIKPLAEANAVSKSDLDAAQASYEAAHANLEAAKANLRSSDINLSYTKVRSPINGIIGKTMARVGEFVGKEPNPVILNTVSKTDTVIVKFFITEKEYIKFAKIRIQNTKEGRLHEYDDIPVELQLSDGSTYEHMGKVDFIDRNIDEKTGSILVQASFPNPDGLLRPGLYSKVKLLADVLEDASVIPQRCIMEIQGQNSVFKVNDSNIVERRLVKVRYRWGDMAAITEGLKSGDKIVIDALQKVRDGMEVIPVDTVFESKVLNPKKQ